MYKKRKVSITSYFYFYLSLYQTARNHRMSYVLLLMDLSSSLKLSNRQYCFIDFNFELERLGFGPNFSS